MSNCRRRPAHDVFLRGGSPSPSMSKDGWGLASSRRRECMAVRVWLRGETFQPPSASGVGGGAGSNLRCAIVRGDSRRMIEPVWMTWARGEPMAGSRAVKLPRRAGEPGSSGGVTGWCRAEELTLLLRAEAGVRMRGVDGGAPCRGTRFCGMARLVVVVRSGGYLCWRVPVMDMVLASVQCPVMLRCVSVSDSQIRP